MAYVMKAKPAADKPGKVLKDDREDFMVVKLNTGETRVVHKNLGEALIAKKAAVKVQAELEDASRAREKSKEAKAKAEAERISKS